MDKRIRTYNILGAVTLFLIAPLLIYTLGDFPRRAFYKEALSALTIVSFFVLLLQFYLSRANKTLLQGIKMKGVVGWHKALGYIFTGILVLHPLFVILYHLFEPGITFSAAFSEIINSLNQKGLLFGLIAWLLMITIALSAVFRNRLFKKYQNWRLFHGILSIAFVTIAALHVLDLGRHINSSMTALIIALVVIAVYKLFRIYLTKTD